MMTFIMSMRGETAMGSMKKETKTRKNGGVGATKKILHGMNKSKIGCQKEERQEKKLEKMKKNPIGYLKGN